MTSAGIEGTRGVRLSASRVSRWTVDGTQLTLETDAAMPVGALRRMMTQDLGDYKRGVRDLAYDFHTTSFAGELGTQIHGRGWKLHVPRSAHAGLSGVRFEASLSHSLALWEAVTCASLADWTEWAEDGVANATGGHQVKGPSTKN
jgi:hypothetical protein